MGWGSGHKNGHGAGEVCKRLESLQGRHVTKTDLNKLVADTTKGKCIHFGSWLHELLGGWGTLSNMLGAAFLPCFSNMFHSLERSWHIHREAATWPKYVRYLCRFGWFYIEISAIDRWPVPGNVPGHGWVSLINSVGHLSKGKVMGWLNIGDMQDSRHASVYGPWLSRGLCSVVTWVCTSWGFFTSSWIHFDRFLYGVYFSWSTKTNPSWMIYVEGF